MELSKRLSVIAGLVTPGGRVADVGSDHGYLPIDLVRRGICPGAIAIDVGKGPLARAKAHIREQGLTDRIEVRLGDGLTPLLPGEADTIVIAGMGGPLMQRILADGEKTAKAAKELVLSPQSDVREFRRFLKTEGYTVTEERMLQEDGKYYAAMRVIPKPDPDEWTEAEYAYGKWLIRERPPVLMAFLQKKLASCEEILGRLDQADPGKATARRREVEAKIREIQDILNLSGEEGEKSLSAMEKDGKG